MKFMTFLFWILFLCLPANAEQASDLAAISTPKGDTASASKKHTLFVYETSSEDASASLDRVSGQIDLGFAGPSQTFRAHDQTVGAHALADSYDQ